MVPPAAAGGEAGPQKSQAHVPHRQDMRLKEGLRDSGVICPVWPDKATCKVED